MPVVDITQKRDALRIARAVGRIRLKEETIKKIKNNRIKKGDVLETARVAALLAVKKTPETIPYCHLIEITNADVGFEFSGDGIEVAVEVKATAKTGVEMEALLGVSTALLTIWDMVKYLEKDEKGQYPGTMITDIRVVEKIKNQTAGGETPPPVLG